MQVNIYPCHHSSGLINMIWEQKSHEARDWQILPSGFVELIFRLGSRFQLDHDKSRLQSTDPVKQFCFLSGLHTKPLYFHYEDFHCMGIQMKPAAVKALFGMPTSDLHNNSLEGSWILDDLPMLEDHLYSDKIFHEKAKFLEQYILSRVRETAGLHRAIKLDRVLTQLTRRKLKGKALDIQSIMGYSRTHSYRIFRKWFGASSSKILKLYQFVHAIEQMHGVPRKLSRPAYQTGHYDQSHFIRSFKAFADMTPGAYKDKRTDIPGQLQY